MDGGREAARVRNFRAARIGGIFRRSIVLCAACFLVCLPLRAKIKPAPHSINLNTATENQLMELPGVGHARAESILNFRQKSGPFRSVNDLLVIRGISKKELDKIRPYIYVGSPPQAHPPAHKPTTPPTRTATPTPAQGATPN